MPTRSLSRRLPLPPADFVSVRTAAEIATVAKIANEIWREHYTPIIGPDQVDYMLMRFQSTEAIGDQIAGGMHYWLVITGSPIGYLAAEARTPALFISKFYLRSSQRGQGYGRQSMDFLADFAKAEGCNQMTLTVNRFNDSVTIYQRLGFGIDGELCQDIGSGYVMDDYAMSRSLTPL